MRSNTVSKARNELIVKDLKAKPNISNKLLAKRYGVSVNQIYILRDKYNIPKPAPYCFDNGRILKKPKNPAAITKKAKKPKQLPLPLASKAKPAPAPAPEPVAKPIDVAAVLTERGKQYGVFSDQARITQQLRNAAHRFAAEHNKVFNSDQALALDMIFVKLGRILSGNPNHVDNWVDIAGYAKLVAERLEGKSR